MSNFFTFGNSFCWHDLSRECPSARQMRSFFLNEQILRPEMKHLGNSDSAMLLFLEDMLEEFPDARWILIKRDPKDCRKSWDGYFTPENPYPGAPTDPESLDRVFKLLETKLEEAEDLLLAAKCARVAFGDLSHERTVRHLWDWCLPGVNFPLNRWKMLNTFRVNVMPNKLVGVS
jgi:hypothetical protein